MLNLRSDSFEDNNSSGDDSYDELVNLNSSSEKEYHLDKENKIKKYQKLIDSYSNKSNKIICNNCFYTPLLSLKLNSTEYSIKWNCNCGNKILTPIEFINLIKAPFNNTKCSKCSINYHYSKFIKCIKCNLVFCDSCYKNHKKNIIKDKENLHLHSAIKLDEICNKCKEHPRLKPNGYCVICKENICIKCFELHKYHNVLKYEDLKITSRHYDNINNLYKQKKQHFLNLFFTREKYYNSFCFQLESLLKRLKQSFEEFKENHFSILGIYETIIDSNKNFFENYYYEKQMNLINLTNFNISSNPYLVKKKDTMNMINDYISKLKNMFIENNENFIHKYPNKHNLDSNYRIFPSNDGNIIVYNLNYIKIIKGKKSFSEIIYVFPHQENIVKIYQIKNGNIIVFNNFYGKLLYNYFLKINNSKYEHTFFHFKSLFLSQIETNYDNLFLFRENFDVQIYEINENYNPILKSNFNIWNNDFSNYNNIDKIKFINQINILILMSKSYYDSSMIVLYNTYLKKYVKKQMFNNKYSNFFIISSKRIIYDKIIFNLLTWQIESILNDHCIGILSNGNLILNNYSNIIIYSSTDFKPIMIFKDNNIYDIKDIFLLNGMIIYKKNTPQIFYIKYTPKNDILFLK